MQILLNDSNWDYCCMFVWSHDIELHDYVITRTWLHDRIASHNVSNVQENKVHVVMSEGRTISKRKMQALANTPTEGPA